MRKTILTTALLTVAILAAGTLPAHADPYQDPLTTGSVVTYNHQDIRLTISPIRGSDQVTRFGHGVASEYTYRVTDPTVGGDKLLASGKLGYYRAAYLHLKLVGQDVARGYGIKTYVKKVTGFSADYAKKQVQAFAVAYRHRTLVLDVKGTANQVEAYVTQHGSVSGIPATQIIKSDGYFGYENAAVRVFADTADSSGKTYQVYGYDPTDGYTSVYDSKSGRVRSGTTASTTAYIPE